MVVGDFYSHQKIYFNRIYLYTSDVRLAGLFMLYDKEMFIFIVLIILKIDTRKWTFL